MKKCIVALLLILVALAGCQIEERDFLEVAVDAGPELQAKDISNPGADVGDVWAKSRYSTLTEGGGTLCSLRANTGASRIDMVIMRVYYYHNIITPNFEKFPEPVTANSLFDEMSYTITQYSSTVSYLTIILRSTDPIPASSSLFLFNVRMKAVGQGDSIILPYTMGIYNADWPWGQILDSYTDIMCWVTVK